ncbi:hypothetical protein K3495_g8869 [Podosphaera aphanis]|nr:hypothetical protein K3495_g8869 [Podosphaera aphanis]
MAKHLLRYLKGPRNFEIKYQALEAEQAEWVAWTDATWGTKEDMKSFQGYTKVATEKKAALVSALECGRIHNYSQLSITINTDNE